MFGSSLTRLLGFIARWARRWLAVAPAACCLLALAGCSTSKSLNGHGVAYYRQGHYDAALASFQQAQVRDPNNPHIYYNIARVYHQKGVVGNDAAALQQAESHYHLCLDRDGEGAHRECYRALSVLLMETNRSDKAFTLLEGWAMRNPRSPEPRIELARLYEEHHELEAAKEKLLEALAMEPNNPRALAALGKIHERRARKFARNKQYDEQQDALAQAMSNYRRSLLYDRQQADVAARVALLQSYVPRVGNSALLPRRDLPRTVNGPTRAVDRMFR